MSDSASNPMRDAIASAISDNPVILFMKGTPEAPACGFSARTVAVLEAVDQPFAAVNILPDPAIRQELSSISGWPTIPQLFVDGELVGGADIVAEMYQSGELHDVLGIERRAADHSGHDHSGHDHSGHDHSGHDHAGHDHAGHDHGEPVPLAIENLL